MKLCKPSQSLSIEKRYIRMKQNTLATAGFGLVTRRTRKRVFLDLRQWFGPSAPAMEEALQDVSPYCEFARLEPCATHLPDESTILRFGKTPSPRHLLEEHSLCIPLLGTINATLIAEPSSTKNEGVQGDPEMPVRFHQGSLQRAGQKYVATEDAICAEQFVDGPGHAFAQGLSVRTTAMWADAQRQPEKATNQAQCAPKFNGHAVRSSLREIFLVNSRKSVGCSGHP